MLQVSDLSAAFLTNRTWRERIRKTLEWGGGGLGGFVPSPLLFPFFLGGPGEGDGRRSLASRKIPFILLLTGFSDV